MMPNVDPQLQVMQEIVQRTADAMVAEGIPYRGVLFAGLMIEGGKAKLLEHNVRFGDPEVQCLLMRMQSDLLPLLLDASLGRLQGATIEWSPDSALSVVLASQGYPGEYKKGTVIRNLHGLKDAKVFHAGTVAGAEGELLANGGRVLAITALGADVLEAQARAYAAVDMIDWPEGFHRSDIGWRAVDRLRASS
jgi:phosphoribosylamine---glycine ligase